MKQCIDRDVRAIRAASRQPGPPYAFEARSTENHDQSSPTPATWRRSAPSQPKIARPIRRSFSRRRRWRPMAVGRGSDRWGINHNALTEQVADRLAINFGAELTKIVPGRVSTEVDADLSFDVEGTVAQAREIIEDYVERGVRRDRVLMKIAATWEGIRAASKSCKAKDRLQSHAHLLAGPGGGLRRCWRLPHLALRRPHPRLARQDRGQDLTAETDPGVLSVKQIYAYYKAYGINTVVMGASFRNHGRDRGAGGLRPADHLAAAARRIRQGLRGFAAPARASAAAKSAPRRK